MVAATVPVVGTPRITIVGGGSTHWTPRLLVDFANTEALCDVDVTLMDTDPDALPLMEEVGGHIAKVRGIGLSVTATTDLGRALDGADMVIIALSVGGFASMRHDLEIPARYGIRQPVGDSVGPRWDRPGAAQRPGGHRGGPGDGAPLPRGAAGQREQSADRTVPGGSGPGVGHPRGRPVQRAGRAQVLA